MKSTYIPLMHDQFPSIPLSGTNANKFWLSLGRFAFDSFLMEEDGKYATFLPKNWLSI